MKNNNLFFGIILAVLIFSGAYYVYSIPSPAESDPSQITLDSDNITTTESGNTLGLQTSATPVSTISATTKMEDKLTTTDITVGSGDTAVAGKKVTVNYLGTLVNGTKFDSSYDRNQPFSFVLGTGEVIQGWDQGVAGMKVGGKRKLTIPPSLGYGSQDLGVIPPNSTLVFEVELLKVE
jgi:FKBP-type peptidyl-prolyl cis-trans isomerase FkpA